MTIYKYQRVTAPGPNGAALFFRAPDGAGAAGAVELAELDGWHYVFMPDGATLPEQHAGIQWQGVTVTSELKEQIKGASRPCQLIAEAVQQRIRAAYTADDEQYLARIGAGAALGLYQFRTGEQAALAAYIEHVEAARLWGRLEREKIGL